MKCRAGLDVSTHRKTETVSPAPASRYRMNGVSNWRCFSKLEVFRLQELQMNRMVPRYVEYYMQSYSMNYIQGKIKQWMEPFTYYTNCCLSLSHQIILLNTFPQTNKKKQLWFWNSDLLCHHFWNMDRKFAWRRMRKYSPVVYWFTPIKLSAGNMADMAKSRESTLTRTTVHEFLIHDGARSTWKVSELSVLSTCGRQNWASGFK